MHVFTQFMALYDRVKNDCMKGKIKTDFLSHLTWETKVRVKKNRLGMVTGNTR